MHELAAWLLLPALFYATSLGLGLLVERLVGARLPNALLAPLGFCVAIVAVYPGYALGISAWLADLLVAGGALAGLAVTGRALRGRLNPGWAGIAGLAVYLLYSAPVMLTGHWTWAGYNFLNDTAVQLELVDWIRHHGTHTGSIVPNYSTTGESIRGTLGTHYPIGSHLHLATLTSLLRTQPEFLYQTYLSCMLAMAGMSLHQLARRLGISGALAAGAVVVALGANLTYQYALQGNIKEMAMVATLAVAAAVGRELLDDERPVVWIALGLCLAAGLAVFSVAGVPYVVALAGCLVLAAFLQRNAAVRRRLVPSAAVALGVALVSSIPVLLNLRTLFRTTNEAFGVGTASAPTLGQLQRPLELKQIAGVWLSGDYTVANPHAGLAHLTTAAAIVLFVFAVGGGLWILRRRETSLLLFLGPTLLVLLIVAPRVTAYPDGKIYAILSPAVVLAAAVGVYALAGRFRALGALVALGLAGLVLWSDAYAYHAVRLVPTGRMAQLQDLGDHFAGIKQPMLYNEYEEFSKYFLRRARINASTEQVTPAQTLLNVTRAGTSGYTWDLDDQKIGFVERWPWIILRRGPATSRPPANYRFVYRNRDYEVWRKLPGPNPVRHVPLGQPQQAVDMPPCKVIRDIARRAPAGTQLVAPLPPEREFVDMFNAPHSANWVPDKLSIDKMLVTAGPGKATGAANVIGGVYTVWLRGSFGRPVSVLIDGTRVGRARGINTPGGWYAVARVTLAPGRHEVQVLRGGGSLRPGDGARSIVGPVSLERAGTTKMLVVAPAQARSLCGKRLDWIDVTRPGPIGE